VIRNRVGDGLLLVVVCGVVFLEVPFLGCWVVCRVG